MSWATNCSHPVTPFTFKTVWNADWVCDVFHQMWKQRTLAVMQVLSYRSSADLPHKNQRPLLLLLLPPSSSPHQSVCHKVTSTQCCSRPRIGPESAVTCRNHFHFQCSCCLRSNPGKPFTRSGDSECCFSPTRTAVHLFFSPPPLLLL